MLVIVKNGPDTPDGKRGMQLARDMCADVCLIQNAVYFAQKQRLEGFCGTVYVLEEDRRLRGLRHDAQKENIRPLDYDGLVELMTGSEKVLGLF